MKRRQNWNCSSWNIFKIKHGNKWRHDCNMSKFLDGEMSLSLGSLEEQCKRNVADRDTLTFTELLETRLFLPLCLLALKHFTLTCGFETNTRLRLLVTFIHETFILSKEPDIGKNPIFLLFEHVLKARYQTSEHPPQRAEDSADQGEEKVDYRFERMTIMIVIIIFPLLLFYLFCTQSCIKATK